MDNGHLSEAEIERILSSEASHSEGEKEKDLLAHCRGCPECAELLNDYGDIHREIESLKELSSHVDQTQCPSAELWIKLAAGVMDKKQAMQLVKHACECRSCAQQLTRAQRRRP